VAAKALRESDAFRAGRDYAPGPTWSTRIIS
jgi:hypothetical protein